MKKYMKYMEDYVPKVEIDEQSGKRKVIQDYFGDWYVWDLGKDVLRGICRKFMVGFAINTGIHFYLGTRYVSINMAPATAIPSTLALIPLLFSWIGICLCLKSAEKKMTLREYKRIHYCVQAGSVLYGVLMCIAALNGIWVLFREKDKMENIFVVMGYLCIALLAVFAYGLQRQLKVRIIKNREKTYEMKEE